MFGWKARPEESQETTFDQNSLSADYADYLEKRPVELSQVGAQRVLNPCNRRNQRIVGPKRRNIDIFFRVY